MGNRWKQQGQWRNGRQKAIVLHYNIYSNGKRPFDPPARDGLRRVCGCDRLMLEDVPSRSEVPLR
jgi:hypothetical protein